MSKALDPERSNVLDFIRFVPYSQFVVPVYQRNYVWTVKKELFKFVEDYKSVLFNKIDKHFIGIIMYVRKQKTQFFTELSVVDGQQRLISIFLMLYALKKIAEEVDDKNSIKTINDYYLFNNNYSEESDKYKIKPLVTADKVFQHIVTGETITKEEKKSNIYVNYKFIYDELKKAHGRYSVEDMLNALNKFYLVVIPLESTEDDAQKIFESINSAGAALSKVDLIRNYLLMNLDNSAQEYYYEKYWYPLEKKYAPSGKIEQFFRMFLANQKCSLPNMDDIYTDFQAWFISIRENISLEDIFILIQKYSEYYYDLYISNNYKISPDVDKKLTEFRKTTIEPTAPLFMEIYNLFVQGKVQSKDFANIIDLFIVFGIRRTICNLTTGILTRNIPILLRNLIDSCNGNYTNIYEKCVRLLVDANKNKKSFLPDDEYLRSNLYAINAYALKNPLFAIFQKIELNNNPAPVDFSKLSIEHLMPQTPSEQWLKEVNATKEDYDYNLHRIGNLTFAAKSDNSKMSNNPFLYKKQILDNTAHLKMNINILKQEKWGFDEIEARTNEIIQTIIELYPYISVGIEERESYSINLFTETTNISALVYDDQTVEIVEGSYFIAKPTNNITEMISQGLIEECDNKYVVTQSIVCKSLNNATELVLPGNIQNIWEIWTDNNADPLSLNLREKLDK